MQDLQTISLVLAATSLIVGVTYYIIILRNASRNRKAQLYLQFQNKSFDPNFMNLVNQVNLWKFIDANDFIQKYGWETNPKEFAQFMAVGSYYDSMGILLLKGLISIDMLPEIMAISVMAFWEKYKSIAQAMGEVFRRPNAFHAIEHLYNAVKNENQTLPMSN